MVRYLIAAGLNPKQLSVFIGHTDIRTTYNRYGHLMPGGEAQGPLALLHRALRQPVRHLALGVVDHRRAVELVVGDGIHEQLELRLRESAVARVE